MYYDLIFKMLKCLLATIWCMDFLPQGLLVVGCSDGTIEVSINKCTFNCVVEQIAYVILLANITTPDLNFDNWTKPY